MGYSCLAQVGKWVMSHWKPFDHSRTIYQMCLLSLLVGPLVVEAQSPRVAFVTSVNGSGNLGSWADAGGAVGAEAGDAICRARAIAAGLANAGSFVAWLSTTTDDAYCRLHGITGKKADNCGQMQLPIDAGPWNRTDGAPFTESIDRLLNPERVVYYPLATDEFGDPVAGMTFSGTSNDGAWLPSYGTCSDWTVSSPVFAWKGNSTRGSGGWTSDGNFRCDGTAHLFCFEPGSGPALSPPDEAGNIGFVTSTNSTGNLGGLTGADAVCQTRAAAAALPDASTYKAWISTSTTDAVDRFQHLGPVIRPDGIKIAHSLEDMVDGQLLASINLTGTGVYLGHSAAWTGSDASGQLSGASCDDWTSNSAGITTWSGATDGSDLTWTMQWGLYCNSVLPRLYCVGDSSVIFTSSFLFGDTSAWSSTVP